VYAKAPSLFVGLLLLQEDEDVHDGCLGEHGYVEWRGKIGFLKNNTRMLGM
jgi:hypothetical protein